MACSLEVVFKGRRAPVREQGVRAFRFADGMPAEARRANGVSDYEL